MNFLCTFFKNIEWGSAADWVSGLLTAISVALALYNSFKRKKPNLNFELVCWEYIKILNNTKDETKKEKGYFLLIQNEEQYSLNIKIKASLKSYPLNNQILHFPSINSSTKPTYCALPIELTPGNHLKLKFINLANNKKQKISIKNKSFTYFIYQKNPFLRQYCNSNISFNDIKLSNNIPHILLNP